MNEIANVSYQVFIQQLQNWELTLSREVKKLKQLRKVVTNRLQVNTIDITLINIESQLIHYKKIRDKKAETQHGVIELYTSLSKRFMNIMEKIGESAENQRYHETNTVQTDTNKTGENYCPNKSKHFLEETFTYKVGKNTYSTKNKSMVQHKNQLNDKIKMKSRGTSRPSKSIEKSRKNIASHYINLNKLELTEEEEDISDIRYQLKEIKSMMSQMEKEIKLHSHDQLDRDVTRLSHNNKKLTLEIKSIKQDSQFVLARLQHLKQQLNHQKAMQAEMIKKIENGRDSRVHVHSINKENKETEDISEWVKIRI